MSIGDFVERGRFQCVEMCPRLVGGWPRFRTVLISLVATFVIQCLKPALLMARPASLAGPGFVKPPSLKAQAALAEQLATQQLLKSVPTCGPEALVDWLRLQPPKKTQTSANATQTSANAQSVNRIAPALP